MVFGVEEAAVGLGFVVGATPFPKFGVRLCFEFWHWEDKAKEPKPTRSNSSRAAHLRGRRRRRRTRNSMRGSGLCRGSAPTLPGTSYFAPSLRRRRCPRRPQRIRRISKRASSQASSASPAEAESEAAEPRPQMLRRSSGVGHRKGSMTAIALWTVNRFRWSNTIAVCVCVYHSLSPTISCVGIFFNL